MYWRLMKLGKGAVSNRAVIFEVISCRRYLEQFSKLTLDDVFIRKAISFPHEEEDDSNETPVTNLSLKLTDLFPSVLVMKAIEKKAVVLLNTPESIVHYPTIDRNDGNKKYLVVGSQSIAHGVKVTAKSKITCDCRGFKFIKLCSHSVAVAEKEGVLKDLVKSVKSSFRSAITYPSRAGGDGRKGGLKR